MPTQAIDELLQLTGSLQTHAGSSSRLPLRCIVTGPTNPFLSQSPHLPAALRGNHRLNHADDRIAMATRLFDSHPLVGSLYQHMLAPTGNGKFYIILFSNRCQRESLSWWHVFAAKASWVSPYDATTRHHHIPLARTKSHPSS